MKNRELDTGGGRSAEWILPRAHTHPPERHSRNEKCTWAPIFNSSYWLFFKHLIKKKLMCLDPFSLSGESRNQITLPTRPAEQIVCVVAEPYGSLHKQQRSLHSFALTKPFGGRFLWQQRKCFYQNNTYSFAGDIFRRFPLLPFKSFECLVRKSGSQWGCWAPREDFSVSHWMSNLEQVT